MTNLKNRKSRMSTSGKRSTSLYKAVPAQPVSHAKKIILPIIILAMLIVVIATFCAFFLKSEDLVKNRMSELASEYYEDYFYENLVNSEKFKKINDIDTVMEKYNTSGLSPVSLNDLLLYDDQKNAKYTDFFTKYCDINSTFVKFFPDPPYEKTSYHTEYIYSCNF